MESVSLVYLNVVKCHIQVNPEKYKNTVHGFKVTVIEDGYRGLARGWAPTCIGYSMQGLYEIFKVLYSNVAGEEKAYLYRTSLYLAASANAELFADVALA